MQLYFFIIFKDLNFTILKIHKLHFLVDFDRKIRFWLFSWRPILYFNIDHKIFFQISKKACQHLPVNRPFLQILDSERPEIFFLQKAVHKSNFFIGQMLTLDFDSGSRWRARIPYFGQNHFKTQLYYLTGFWGILDFDIDQKIYFQIFKKKWSKK